MNTAKYCQSCSMPLDNEEILGTERNGSKNEEYCKYCYVNGSFINPDMKIDDMRVIVRTQMEKRNIPSNVIEMAVNILPQLKRWKIKGPVAF